MRERVCVVQRRVSVVEPQEPMSSMGRTALKGETRNTPTVKHVGFHVLTPERRLKKILIRRRR